MDGPRRFSAGVGLRGGRRFCVHCKIGCASAIYRCRFYLGWGYGCMSCQQFERYDLEKGMLHSFLIEWCSIRLQRLKGPKPSDQRKFKGQIGPKMPRIISRMRIQKTLRMICNKKKKFEAYLDGLFSWSQVSDS